ncbi:hypothetical protein PSCICN_28860 [Pseudomonas cichorii]|nr:hypothetical protein PSCICN_28860 [Pseudomonas cichorii]
MYSNAIEIKGTIMAARIKEYFWSMFLEWRLLNIGMNFTINGIASANAAR